MWVLRTCEAGARPSRLQLAHGGLLWLCTHGSTCGSAWSLMTDQMSTWDCEQDTIVAVCEPSTPLCPRHNGVGIVQHSGGKQQRVASLKTQ
jgi:hypothetical protein